MIRSRSVGWEDHKTTVLHLSIIKQTLMNRVKNKLNRVLVKQLTSTEPIAKTNKKSQPLKTE